MDRISFFKQEKIIPFVLNILENSNSIQKLWAKIMMKVHTVRYDFFKRVTFFKEVQKSWKLDR